MTPPRRALLLGSLVAAIGASAEVSTTGDAEEALAALESFHPHLSLMDLQLPGMDGFELIQQLNADPVPQHVVLLGLTPPP